MWLDHRGVRDPNGPRGRDRGFRVIIADYALTEMSEELHEAALLAFSWTFGRTIDVENLDLLEPTGYCRGLRYS